MPDIYPRFRPRDLLLDKDGRFLPDPVPMAPPVGYVKQESMSDIVRRMVQGEHLRLAALEAGQETFDEAEDFDVGDDFDPTSPYEEIFDPVDTAVRDRLRQADWAATVQSRLDTLAAKAGVNDGKPNNPSDQGGTRDPSGVRGNPDPLSQGQPGAQQNAPDGANVRKADTGAGAPPK